MKISSFTQQVPQDKQMLLYQSDAKPQLCKITNQGEVPLSIRKTMVAQDNAPDELVRLEVWNAVFLQLQKIYVHSPNGDGKVNIEVFATNAPPVIESDQF